MADTASLPDWLEAVGTLAAVVVALFLGPVQTWWRRPRLEILDVEKDPEKDEDVAPIQGKDRVGAYAEVSVRAKIHNQGRGDARGVRVFVKTVLFTPPGGSERRAQMPDCHLKWAGPDPEKEMLVPPHSWRRIDLLRYRKAVGDGQPDEPVLALALLRPGNTLDNDVARWPPSPRNRLLTGRYDIDVELSCDSGRTAVWRFTVDVRRDIADPVAVRVDGAALDMVRRVEVTEVKRLTGAAAALRR